MYMHAAWYIRKYEKYLYIYTYICIATITYAYHQLLYSRILLWVQISVKLLKAPPAEIFGIVFKEVNKVTRARVYKVSTAASQFSLETVILAVV